MQFERLGISIRESVPEAPPRDEVLASTAVCAEGVRAQIAIRHRTAVALRTAAALAVFALAIAGVRLAGFGNDKLGLGGNTVNAAMTPLFSINAVWDAAYGYKLDFHIYDERESNPDIVSQGSRNIRRMQQEITAWAKAHGLEHTVPPEGQMYAGGGYATSGVVFFRSGVGRVDELSWEHAQLMIRLDDESIINALAHELAQLPGVSVPATQRQVFHYSPYGFAAAIENAAVIIDGQRYEFPKDFTPAEFNQLVSRFSYLEKYGPDYRAFPVNFLKDRTTGTQRITVGDVIRQELDEKGNLVITTVVEEWEVPAEARNFINSSSGQLGGWGFGKRGGVDASKIDVLTELSRKFDPLPGDVEQRRYSLNGDFWLIPRDQVVRQGGASVTAEQQEYAEEISRRLDAAVEAFKDVHPKHKRSLVYNDWIRGGPQEWGQTPIKYSVGGMLDELSDAQELLRALRDAGAPEGRMWLRNWATDEQITVELPEEQRRRSNQ